MTKDDINNFLDILFWDRMEKFRKTGEINAIFDARNVVFQQVTQGGSCHNVMQGIAEYRDHGTGTTLKDRVESVIQHYREWRRGWTDENHARAAIWGLTVIAFLMEHRPDLDDYTEKGGKSC